MSPCSEHTGLVATIEGMKTLNSAQFEALGREMRDVKKMVRWLVIALFSVALSIGGVKAAQELLRTAPAAAADVVSE